MAAFAGITGARSRLTNQLATNRHLRLSGLASAPSRGLSLKRKGKGLRGARGNAKRLISRHT